MADPFMVATYKEEQRWLADETSPVRKGNPVRPAEGFRIEYTDKKGRVHQDRLALLSWNQKTVSPSFDLPAVKTCPGAAASLALTRIQLEQEMPLFEPGICTLCYAAKGPYVWQSNVSRAAARLAFSRSTDFVDTMIEAIRHPRKYISNEFEAKRYDPHYFRVHSSGDLYDAAYVEKWVAICAAIPQTRFWFPTRVWAAPASKMTGRMVKALAELSSLENAVLRPSMLGFNQLPGGIASGNIAWAMPSGGLIFKTLSDVMVRVGRRQERLTFPAREELEEKWKTKGVWFCPATPRDHDGKTIAERWNCVAQGCRKCWDHPEIPIAYRVH